MSYNPYDEVEINETNIIDTRDDLLFEICNTGSACILGHKVTMSELLEDMDQEEKDNAFAMLVSRNENDDAKEYATEKLMEIFRVLYDDAVIEEHYIDMQSEY